MEANDSKGMKVKLLTMFGKGVYIKASRRFMLFEYYDNVEELIGRQQPKR